MYKAIWIVKYNDTDYHPGEIIPDLPAEIADELIAMDAVEEVPQDPPLFETDTAKEEPAVEEEPA